MEQNVSGWKVRCPNDPDFALPDIAAAHKDKRVWGLFTLGAIDAEKHKKGPIKLNTGKVQSATRIEDLWTYEEAAGYWKQGFALSLSLPRLGEELGGRIVIADHDEWKAAYGEAASKALLQKDTFIGISASGQGRHRWEWTREDILPARPKNDAVDNLGTYVVLSGYADCDERVMEIVLTESERDDLARTREAEPNILSGKLILPNGQMSVFGAGILQLGIEAELLAYGYQPRGARWLYCSSTTGMPGGKLFDSSKKGQVFYTHHGDDPLSGRAVDVVQIRIQRMINNGDANDEKQAVAKLAKELKAVDGETGEVLDMTVHQFNERQRAKETSESVDNREDVGNTIELPPLPLETLAPMDLFGNLVRAVERTQWKPNLMSSLAAALGTVAGLGGGKYSGESLKDRCNVQILLLGESGSGKDTGIEAPHSVLSRMQYEGRKYAPEMRAPEWVTTICLNPPGSPEGLEDELRTLPDRLILWDEMAADYSMAESGRATNYAQVINRMTRLWSRASGIEGTRSKSGQPGEPIHAPNVSLICTSTEEKMAAAIGPDFFTDGRGARLITLPIDAYQGEPRKAVDPMRLGEELTVNLIKLANADVTFDQRVHEPRQAAYDDGVLDYFHNMALQASALPVGSVAKGLQNRRAMLAKSVALLRAMLLNPDRPKVTMGLAQWAHEVIEHADQYKLRLATEKVSFNADHRAVNAVLGRLRKADGQWVPRKVLTNNLSAMKHLKSNDREAVLRELEKNSMIVVETHIRESGGRPKIVYKLAD